MPPLLRASVRDLDTLEIEEILLRNTVGRIAFVRDGRVDVEPIHYVFEEGALYGRTAPGAKLSAVGQNPVVAFEVDEVNDTFDWRSVVVHGPFYRIPEDRVGREPPLHRRALQLLRTIVPTALTEQDPTPERTVLFRIMVKTATGRCCTTEACD